MKKLLKITFTLFFTTIIVLCFALPLNPVGNWFQQFLPNIGSKQINDIIFLDSLNGFAIASRNVNPDTSSILRTTNGGNNWQIVQILSSRRFSRIKFINNLTGFISGGSGSGTPYLYKTIDGGSNWNVVPEATLGNAFWSDMTVLSEVTLWLVDANSLNGGVFFTSNGGTNWTQQLNLGSQNPEKIYMYNGRIGFMANNSGSPNVYKTTNSGVNWTININGDSFYDMYFIDSLTGWKANFSTIKKTTNGGANWLSQTIPFGGILITPGITAISVLNRDTIWGVGGEAFYGAGQFRGVLYRTTNGGSTWLFQIPDTTIHLGAYGIIKFTDKYKGWAYTTYGGIHTTTGGDPVWLTGVEQTSTEIPKEYSLFQNYPNPFNPVTNIRYEIKVKGIVKLRIFDIIGREITALVNMVQSAGTYKVDFSGNGLSSGVYFYSLIADGVLIDTKKMLLIK